MIKKLIGRLFNKKEHNPILGAKDILKYIGPGLIVTVGFIDPGNWAANVSAGAFFGYKLLWMVTLATIMLIMLQHNAAHLGIVSGLCISEASTKYMPKKLSVVLLLSAFLAACATVMAEILGGAIALKMLFHLPLKLGAVIVALFSLWMIFSNSYKKIERIIIGFVSLIGISFIFELALVNSEWGKAASGWVTPSFPEGSMLVIVSVLGAVVMPHNLFLHSEVIQSRQWNLENEDVIEKQLKYEFMDTFFSMIVGWAINSAMIILAAATFFANKIKVTELEQAEAMLRPILGNSAAIIFALALLFAGLSSSITACMASGSIVSGVFQEPYDIKDNHTKLGVIGAVAAAMLALFFIGDSFKGLVISQMLLSMQLPITIFSLIYLTSSEKVMGKHKNKKSTNYILFLTGAIVTLLNIVLIVSYFI